jgi:hypothetical protein
LAVGSVRAGSELHVGLLDGRGSTAEAGVAGVRAGWLDRLPGSVAARRRHRVRWVRRLGSAARARNLRAGRGCAGTAWGF